MANNFKYLIECENLEEFFSKGLKFQKKVENETQFIYSIIFLGQNILENYCKIM